MITYKDLHGSQDWLGIAQRTDGLSGHFVNSIIAI